MNDGRRTLFHSVFDSIENIIILIEGDARIKMMDAMVVLP